MRRTLTPMELRRMLGEVLDRVALRQDEFVITRRGKPMAAVVPIEKLEALQRAARLHLGDALGRSSKRELDEQAADELANEAKHATRPRRS